LPHNAAQWLEDVLDGGLTRLTTIRRFALFQLNGEARKPVTEWLPYL
jgi:hypothetical protein